MLSLKHLSPLANYQQSNLQMHINSGVHSQNYLNDNRTSDMQPMLVLSPQEVV